MKEYDAIKIVKSYLSYYCVLHHLHVQLLLLSFLKPNKKNIEDFQIPKYYLGASLGFIPQDPLRK